MPAGQLRRRSYAIGLLICVAALSCGRRASPRHVQEFLKGEHPSETWLLTQRSYPTGRAPAPDSLDRAMRIYGDRQSGRPQLVLPGERWVPIGPSSITVPTSATATPILPYAGRVTAIAPHPTVASTIYIGTDSGGIWRTTDAGASWTSLTDTLPVPAIQSLAIDPVDPRILYAATTQRTYGTRWLRSTDAGANWDVSNIVTDTGQTLSPALCSVNAFKACIPPSSGRIVIDPARAGSGNTSTVYFTGASHILRSDDSGRTFRSLLSLPTDLDFAGPDAATKNPEAQYIRDFAVDPVRPARLFAAVAQPKCARADCTTMTSTIGVYRSLDSGAHWTRFDISSLTEYSLANTRYADPGAVYVPRVRVAVAPSNPDTVAFAFRDEPNVRVRVFRSTNGGDDWAETSRINGLTWPLALAFAPNDANAMYVGSNSVYRSSDAGQTWTNFTQTHADNVVIAFTANRTLLIGGDGGLYMGTNSNTALATLNTALPITEFYSVAAHPTNGLLLAGGTQDNGTVVFQGPLGWVEVLGADGGDTLFDPTPNVTPTLYGEFEWFFTNGGQNVFDFFRCQSTGCVTRSTGIDTTLDGPFAPRFALDASNPSTIWLTAEKLFRTDNRGDSWTAASPSVAASQRCWTDAGVRSCANAKYFVAAAVAPTASQTVYAGTLNGDVWVTDNRGSTWRSVAGTDVNPLPVRPVNEIAVDPLNAQSVFVSYSGFDSGGSGRGHVFRTTNGGQTWQDITGNLPDVPVNSLLIDPDSLSGTTRVLYAGTDIGVFRVTLDGSSPNWQPFGNGLPPVIVTRLAYNATTHQLLAATYARGIWAISSRFSR